MKTVSTDTWALKVKKESAKLTIGEESIGFVNMPDKTVGIIEYSMPFIYLPKK